MSLINQMLKDLDARSKQGQPVAAMPSAVRAVPEYPPPSRGWHWMLALALALLVVVFCFAWFIPRSKLEWHTSAPAADTPASTTPVPVAAKAAASSEPGRQAASAATSALSPTPSLTPSPAATPEQVASSLPEALEAASPPASAPVNARVAEVPAAPEKTPAMAGKDLGGDPKGLKLRLIPELKLLVGDSISPPRPEQKSSMRAAAPVVAKAESGAKALAVNPPLPASTEGVKQSKPLSLPQRAENEYRRALQAQQQGRQLDAMAALEQALQLDRQHTAARQTLVAWLLDQGQREEAIRHLKEGLAHDPGQAGLAMILARLQVDQGQVALALATLQRSLPYTLEGADYHAFMAALLQRQQNHKAAIEHYQIALRLQPEHALWWMGIGISYQAERQNAAAREAYGHAKSNPGLTPGFSPELQAFVEQKLNQLP